MAQDDYRIGTGSMSKEFIDAFDRMLLQSRMGKKEEDLTLKKDLINQLSGLDASDDTKFIKNNRDQLAKMIDSGITNPDLLNLAEQARDHYNLNIIPLAEKRDAIVSQNTLVHQALESFSNRIVSLGEGKFGFDEQDKVGFDFKESPVPLVHPDLTNAIDILTAVGSTDLQDLDDAQVSNIAQMKEDSQTYADARFVLDLIQQHDDPTTGEFDMPQSYKDSGNPIAQPLYNKMLQHASANNFGDAKKAAVEFLNSDAIWAGEKERREYQKSQQPGIPGVSPATIAAQEIEIKRKKDRDQIINLSNQFKTLPPEILKESFGKFAKIHPWKAIQLTQGASKEEIENLAKNYEDVFVSMLEQSDLETAFEINGRVVNLEDTKKILLQRPRGTKTFPSSEYTDALTDMLEAFGQTIQFDKGITDHDYTSIITNAPGKFDEKQTTWAIGQIGKFLAYYVLGEDYLPSAQAYQIKKAAVLNSFKNIVVPE